MFIIAIYGTFTVIFANIRDIVEAGSYELLNQLGVPTETFLFFKFLSIKKALPTNNNQRFPPIVHSLTCIL